MDWYTQLIDAAPILVPSIGALWLLYGRLSCRLEEIRKEMREDRKAMDQKFDKIDQRFEHLDNKIDQRFDRLIEILLIQNQSPRYRGFNNPKSKKA